MEQVEEKINPDEIHKQLLRIYFLRIKHVNSKACKNINVTKNVDMR